MKKLFATLTITLLLAAFVSGANAQETEQKKEEKPAQSMPMMQGMMGGQRGMMGGQMPMMQGGMMCPMCSQMMSNMSMMQGMMGGQRSMMGQMPMMQMMCLLASTTKKDIPNAQKLLALADELKLKEEQIKSLKNISLNLKKESVKKNADLNIARIELNALLDQEEIDLEQVQQKVREVANLEAELRIVHIKASIEAKKVLTNEQRALFKKIIKKRAKTMKKPATQKVKKEKSSSKTTERETHHQ